MTNPTPELDMSGQESPPEKGDDGGGGIKQWVIDSYNGLYKIVLEPSMPTRGQVYLVILGAIIGLIWAWALFPAVFTGANPERLNQNAQDQWVKMVAIAASVGNYNDTEAIDLVSRVSDPLATVNRLLSEATPDSDDVVALQHLQRILPAELTGAPQPDAGGLLTSIWQILLLIVLIGIVVPIVVLLWRLLIQPIVVAPMLDNIKAMTNKEYAERRKIEHQARKAAQDAADAKRSLVVEVDAALGEPIMKTLSIFASNREYDDSFEIELPLDQGGDFLGQCGATVAEAVAPDKVAVEMWLFDMFTQQDKKKVFITEAGYNDPAIRGRIEASLENPSDLIVAKDGVKLIVDSDKLRLQGEMKSLQVGANGRFESFQMPIAAWRKDGSAASAGVNTPSIGEFAAPPPTPAGAPDMAAYDDIQFDPPPIAPSGGLSMSDYDNLTLDPPPTLPGQQSLQPPPLQPPMQQPPPASTGLQPLQPPPLQNPFGWKPATVGR
ncbi:MAG: hypothetical protein Q9P01_17445 [Anaerolineae bacterium]|nr:hypothetical protein [Anaerolineae bacterium]